jgi:hypothetical protein
MQERVKVFTFISGHGEQNLSVVLAFLMLLAFLVDQTQQLCCPLFQAAWHKLGTKRHLWRGNPPLFSRLPVPLHDGLADGPGARHRATTAGPNEY